MQRFLLPFLIAVATLVPAAGVAHATPPPAQAVLVGCETSLDRAARAAVFEGRMRAVADAVRLRMRVTLQTRASDDDGWEILDAEGFGEWKTADLGVRKYVLTKAVGNLAAPAAYRVTIRFRWLDATGRTILQRRLPSPVCRQPDLRPDLEVTRIEIAPGPDAEHRRYVVGVRNEGRSAAGPFGLMFSLGGVDRVASLNSLGAGDRTSVSFVAPRCAAGATLSASVDPEGVVDEREEDDDVFRRSCPTGSASS